MRSRSSKSRSGRRPRRKDLRTGPQLYRLIRLVLGQEISDNAIARQWGVDRKTFNDLKHDRLTTPNVARLLSLARFIGVDQQVVFAVAAGADPAQALRPGNSEAAANLYRFIRLRLGPELSDEEIARRCSMGADQVIAMREGRGVEPRLEELVRLAEVLGVHRALVFEVARGVPPEKVDGLLRENDAAKLAAMLLEGVQALRTDVQTRETLYQSMSDRATDAIFTVDLQGHFRCANRALRGMSGLSESDLRNLSLFDVVHRDDLPRLLETLAAVYKAGEVRNVDLRVQFGATAPRALELGATRIDDARGAPVGLQIVARDLTERRRLLDELDRERQTLKVIFDSVPAACILFAKDGTILAANPLVENVCEHSATEILGKNAFDVFGNPGPAACPVTRAFTTGRFEQQVSQMKNRRGEPIWVHRTAGPVVDHGEIAKVIEIMVDVTEQMRRGDPRLLGLWTEATTAAATAPTVGARVVSAP